MSKVFRLICATVISIFISTLVFAADINQCISESTGLAGYQFKNNCDEQLLFVFQSGLGESAWKGMAISPGQTKVLSSINTPYFACPFKDRQGRDVGFDPVGKTCKLK